MRPFLLQLLLLLASARAGGLHFDGHDDYVTFGVAPALGLPSFTVECWFRWDGEGATASTGSGGLRAWPLVAKGRGESDGGTQDMAWFLGIEEGTGTLAADFEDMETGLNHPVHGSTDIRDGAWHHAAVSYDGETWALYLDGVLDGAATTGGATPRHDSLQHASIATAQNTSGGTAGLFRGAVDETRLWSRARTIDEIREGMNLEIDVGDGLVARWGCDEGEGVTLHDALGGTNGTLVGAAWAGGAPFDANLPPEVPRLVAPADGASLPGNATDLEVEVADFEADRLTVTFWGRPLTERHEDFSLVMLPDTQYYCSGGNGGEAGMFTAQTSWIVANREALGIAYVAHVGDIVNNGDTDMAQWDVADAAMSLLDDPVATGLEDGIPYGLAVGNHDQSPNGDPSGTTVGYDTFFGLDRFEHRSWYGGHLGEDHHDHFSLFSAGGLDFLVLFMEYSTAPGEEVLSWAEDVLAAFPERRAILVAHSLLKSDGAFSTQGALLYDRLSAQGNLFLMLAGHITGEVARTDVSDAGTVHTLMADYQFGGGGGNGWLRLLTFSPAWNVIHVETYSPWFDTWQTDENSDFILDYAMAQDEPWRLLGTRDVASGTRTSMVWEGLAPRSAYEWRVEVDDGRRFVEGPSWTFTTGDASDDTGLDPDTGGRDSEADEDSDESAGDSEGEGKAECGCGSAGPRRPLLPPLAVALLFLGLGTRGRRRGSDLAF
jgi:hypothetical protein